MDITLWVLVIMIAIALGLIIWRGRWPLLITAFKQVGRLFQMVGLRILLGMTLGGMIQILIPSSLVGHWIGPASGLRGILTASYLGILMVGGPYVYLPIIVSLYHAGAGVGPTISLFTAAELLSMQAVLVYDIPFLGLKIGLTRYVIALFIPPVVGIAGAIVYQMLSAI